MPGFRFTLRTVAELSCPPGKKDTMVFDPTLPGFGVRVGAAGGKTFVAQVTVNGVKRRVPLGRFGTVTLEQARAEAMKVLRAAAAGTDLVAEKREQEVRAAERKRAAAFTFGVLVHAWADAREGERRPSYLREARGCLLRNFEGWLARPAASITAAEVVEELDRIKAAKSVVVANRSLAYMRAAYSWAVRRHRVPMNPAKGVEQPGRETSRERVLSQAELRAIWTACDALSLTQAGFVRMAMLTLGRRDEVASMRWDELDDIDSPTTWTLPRERSKNRRAHVVHLSQPARDIIAAMPRMENNPFIFSGRSDGPVAAFSRIKDTLDGKLPADMKPWVPHDFRRSGVTALATSGVPPHVADRLLNHLGGTIAGVQAVYQKAQFLAERKAALDAWAMVVVPSEEDRSDATP